MSVSLRASLSAPIAAVQDAPAAKASAPRASQNLFRRSHAPTPAAAAEAKARPHSLLGYLPSFAPRPGPSSFGHTAAPAAPPSPLTRCVSRGAASDASLATGPAPDSIAPSIRLDPYATGEFKDTEQKRFLGVGPKIYTRAERQLKEKLRTQANMNFDQVARLRESVTELRGQLHEVRTDRDVIRDACVELEQTLVRHKETIRSHESLFHTYLADVSGLKERLLAKEMQLEQIKTILTP